MIDLGWSTKMTMIIALTKRLVKSSNKKLTPNRNMNHNGALQEYFLEARSRGIKGCIARS
jgi:hypothetical protein